jgi:predicted Zn-dependent protease
MSVFGYGYNNYGNNGGGFNLRLLIGLGIAAFAVIAYMTHVSVNPVTGEKQHLSMTPQQETQLGIASAPQMAAQFNGLVPADDPESMEVVRVGRRIATHSDAAKAGYPYQYHLLNDTHMVNAFALPGGQIFITKALYDDLADEAELAGVLGHETGHVVERHSAQQLEQSQLGNRLVAAVAVGSNHPLSNGAIAEVVNQVTQLKFSRNDESQADERGVQFMAQAGYDPRAMIDVMQVLISATQAGRQPEFLLTHPYPEDRKVAIGNQIRQEFTPDQLADLAASRERKLPRD